MHIHDMRTVNARSVQSIKLTYCLGNMLFASISTVQLQGDRLELNQ